MEFGTLMMMVRHRVHGWQMAMRSQKGLHRGTTTLNINAAGLKRMEDAAFMHHIRKPVDKPHNLNWWHFNFFWGATRHHPIRDRFGTGARVDR